MAIGGRYCSVCGRALLKSKGLIGPVCLRKMMGKNKTVRISGKMFARYANEHDIFKEEDRHEQRKDAQAGPKSTK